MPDNAWSTGYRDPDGYEPEPDPECVTPEDAADNLAEALMARLKSSNNLPDDDAFRQAICLIALELHARNSTARADRRREDSRKQLHEMYLSGQYDL